MTTRTTTQASSQRISPPPAIVSESPHIERILEIASKVAPTDVQVLILGESGVGKELIARHIHQASDRADEPFVKVNCSALPDTLVESELFGHEKGSFTGATERSVGKFEQAGAGTILLDEIGEMPLQSQAKLLHVLQDREFTRVGGKSTLQMNARVVATTNRKLDEEVAAGRFREDLYFRLAVVLLEVPPLRRRPEDIPALVEHFADKYGDEYDVEDTDVPTELMDAFLDHGWPGNVRELENVIKGYLLLGNPARTMAGLQKSTTTLRGQHVGNGNGNGNGNGAGFDIEIDEDASLIDIGAAAAEQAEKRAVLEALDQTNWNRKKAAQRLNVCYKTLLNKLSRWDLDGLETTNGGGRPRTQ